MIFLKQLTSILKPYWKQVIFALFTLLLITGSQLIIPSIIQRVIDQGLISGNTEILIWSGGIILGLGIFRAFVFFLNRYTSAWVAQKVAFDLRNALYDHIQHLSFSYHDKESSGQLISRTIEDVNATNQFIGFGVIEIIRVGVLIIGINILLFKQNPFLAAIALIPMFPLVILTTRFGQRISKLFYEVDLALGELSTRLQENVSGVQVVKAFSRESFEMGRFEKANRSLYHTQVNVFAEFAKIFPTTHLMVTIGTILILWFGGKEVLNGDMTIGELAAFNSYLLLMAGPAQQLAWVVNLAGEAAAGMNRIFEVLNRDPVVRNKKDSVINDNMIGRVEFKDVWFRYADEPNYVLESINLSVEKNQVIALIGATGSGKSSLINLIPRFYDVEKGAILIDGVDVRDLDITSMRRQIGMVLQTPLLFSDSIAENIAYGRPNASDEDIINAAKAAQAHDFIMEMAEGYDTIVGERGVTLSGGQRQRISIARALLTDPRILILDDSTSSVDTETEFHIQQALSLLMEGRTTFVIAHRLSTVRKADHIVVLEKGKIVEQGKHEDLLAKGGIYTEIFDMQLKHQVDSEPHISGE